MLRTDSPEASGADRRAMKRMEREQLVMMVEDTQRLFGTKRATSMSSKFKVLVLQSQKMAKIVSYPHSSSDYSSQQRRLHLQGIKVLVFISTFTNSIANELKPPIFVFHCLGRLMVCRLFDICFCERDEGEMQLQRAVVSFDS